MNTAFRAMRDLEAGITYINAGTIGAEVHLPFGGVKGTGNGHREAGQAALDVFTEWKSIYVDYSGKLQTRPDRHRRVARSLNRKLVVFVPREALDPLREALVRRRRRPDRRLRAVLLVHGGDGHVPRGRGLDRRASDSPGREQRVAELRLETVYPEEREAEVVAALREAHPYEEPAFDLYPLA